jgi:hypothetical protein
MANDVSKSSLDHASLVAPSGKNFKGWYVNMGQDYFPVDPATILFQTDVL